MTHSNIPQLNSQLSHDWLHFLQSLNPHIDPGAIRLMDELRLVAHALYLVAENSLTQTGLSLAKYRILMSLLFAEQREEGPMLTPSEISRRQGTSRNTISSLIRDLEEEGFIERHLDPHDRRKFNIGLTPTGRHFVGEHAANHLHIISECFNRLTTEEQATLSQLLVKLGNSLGKQPASA